MTAEYTPVFTHQVNIEQGTVILITGLMIMGLISGTSKVFAANLTESLYQPGYVLPPTTMNIQEDIMADTDRNLNDSIKEIKAGNVTSAHMGLNAAHHVLLIIGNARTSDLLVEHAINALSNHDKSTALMEINLVLGRNSLTDLTPDELKADSLLYYSPAWTRAFEWISQNTLRNSTIASWWDYGYYIKNFANRSSLAEFNRGIQDVNAQNLDHIASIAKMFIDQKENGIKVAQDLKADYILVYVVGQRFSGVNGTEFYTLGSGGDESKKQWFMRIGGFDKSNYLQQDGFTPTPRFWNTTLLGQLIPFRPQAYASFQEGQLTYLNSTYSQGSVALYVKDIKFPQGNLTDGSQPLSLVYSSPSFNSNELGQVFVVFIYKVNHNYVPKITSNPYNEG